MQSAAAACICNLAANLNSKEIIATSGALQVSSLMRSLILSCLYGSVGQSMFAFWSIRSKWGLKWKLKHERKCATDPTTPPLLQVLVEVLQSENQAAAAQAAGALWSLCVDNDANKQATYLRYHAAGAVESDGICTPNTSPLFLNFTTRVTGAFSRTALAAFGASVVWTKGAKSAVGPLRNDATATARRHLPRVP
jgi:hypothetical protein